MVGVEPLEDKQTPHNPDGSKKKAIIATLSVAAATVLTIFVGKQLAPTVIAMMFESASLPAIPARPVGSMLDLTAPQASVRQKAIRVLAKLNPSNSDVFRKLAKSLLEDSDAGVRLEAATAFAGAEPFPQFLPNLLEALSDNDNRVREQLLLAIGNHQASAIHDIAALKQIVDSDSETESNSQLAAAIVDRIQLADSNENQPPY